MADVKFGLGQLKNETPYWAKIMFRVSYWATKAFIGWMAATNLLETNTKYEITIGLTLVVDPLIYSLSKMFGVQLEDNKEDTNSMPEQK